MKVGKYFVDGMCGDEIWEVNGCLYHSCVKRIPDNRSMLHTLTKLSHNSIFQLHKNKVKYLENSGFVVHVKSEHEFCEDVKNNQEMCTY